jgi:ribonucleotide reductase beta subunit family protein with ferritin-like domain
MMLLSFAAREAIHVAAYSHLIESLGMPDTIYNEFFEYEEMRAKHDFFEQISGQNSKTIAQQIAAFSAFTEGLQLFSSFIMLLNFQRHGKMKGMGQIISWSLNDEAVLEGTEVLTEAGWKPIETLSLDENILQYDMNTKEASFVLPNKIQKVQRDNSFVFESDTIHQHVSPNHRMIIMDDNGNVSEAKAFECSENVSLIVSGNKISGDDVLTEEDKICIDSIVSGDLDVTWIYNKIPHISKEWAKDAVNYYLRIIT